MKGYPLRVYILVRVDIIYPWGRGYIQVGSPHHGGGLGYIGRAVKNTVSVKEWTRVTLVSVRTSEGGSIPHP